MGVGSQLFRNDKCSEENRKYADKHLRILSGCDPKALEQRRCFLGKKKCHDKGTTHFFHLLYGIFVKPSRVKISWNLLNLIWFGRTYSPTFVLFQIHLGCASCIASLGEKVFMEFVVPTTMWSQWGTFPWMPRSRPRKAQWHTHQPKKMEWRICVPKWSALTMLW